MLVVFGYREVRGRLRGGGGETDGGLMDTDKQHRIAVGRLLCSMQSWQEFRRDCARLHPGLLRRAIQETGPGGAVARKEIESILDNLLHIELNLSRVYLFIYFINF